MSVSGFGLTGDGDGENEINNKSDRDGEPIILLALRVSRRKKKVFL